MVKFFKDYFIFSHEFSGYNLQRGPNPNKISYKQRKRWLIVCYIFFVFSFLIFFLSLKVFQKIFLWMCIAGSSVMFIEVYDFNILRIFKLYLYSKSKNVNKYIIYDAYFNYNKYVNTVNDYFKNYKKKNTNISESSTRTIFYFNCGKNRIVIKIKPRKTIIKINFNKETIKSNINSFYDILNIVKKKIENA